VVRGATLTAFSKLLGMRRRLFFGVCIHPAGVHSGLARADAVRRQGTYVYSLRTHSSSFSCRSHPLKVLSKHITLPELDAAL
jgi:hypothetical protein